MELRELRSLLTNLLDEDGVRRAPAVMNATLNDGYQVSAILSQGCEVTKTFTFNDVNHFIYLPTDFYVPTSVYFDNVRLDPVRMSDLDFLASQWMETAPSGGYFVSDYFAPDYFIDYTGIVSTPLYYFTVGSLQAQPQLWVYPRSSTIGRVKMTYSIMPQRLGADTDTPRLPGEHQYCIVLWAYAWELLKERGALLANKAFRVFNQYMEAINTLQGYVYRRTPDRDYQMLPWDMEAMRKKLLNFEPVAGQPMAQTTELRDLGA